MKMRQRRKTHYRHYVLTLDLSGLPREILRMLNAMGPQERGNFLRQVIRDEVNRRNS